MSLPTRAELASKNPRYMPLSALSELGHEPKSASKAIRHHCLDCSGGSAVEVKKCEAVGCALWPFRFGKSPFIRRKRAG